MTAEETVLQFWTTAQYECLEEFHIRYRVPLYCQYLILVPLDIPSVNIRTNIWFFKPLHIFSRRKNTIIILWKWPLSIEVTIESVGGAKSLAVQVGGHS